MDDIFSDYSVTKARDDLHHLKYDHGLDDDDDAFDIAFEFFKDCTVESGCDVTECQYVARYYRDRGPLKN